MKKKLPKAVMWTADDMRESGAAANQRHDAPHPADLNEPLHARTPTLNAGAPGNVIEMMPKTEATMNAKTQSPPKSADIETIRRRMRARAIVERHANFSAIGGAIPLPIVNIASITAIIVRMVKSLSGLYGVPFQRNRTRAIVIGLMGGVMPTGLATAAASTLMYFVPGYNLVGLAVSSVTASATARSIGQIFIDHFENGSTLVDFPSAILR